MCNIVLDDSRGPKLKPFILQWTMSWMKIMKYRKGASRGKRLKHVPCDKPFIWIVSVQTVKKNHIVLQKLGCNIFLWCHFPWDGLPLISLSPLLGPPTVAQTQLLHSLRVFSDAFIHKTILAVCPKLLFVLLACFSCKNKCGGKNSI